MAPEWCAVAGATAARQIAAIAAEVTVRIALPLFHFLRDRHYIENRTSIPIGNRLALARGLS